MRISYPIILLLKNFPGPRVKGKIVIFECDDWGGIRMPSKEVYVKMLKYKIPDDKCRYTKFDTLADKQDLEQLFEILFSVRDKNGNPAVMTPVVNVANPDFKKIKEADFSQYYYESFTDTLKRYYPESDTFNVWKEGMRQGIFLPEYHGREHISVQHWLQKLREGDRRIRYAFDHEFVSVPIVGTHPAIVGFRPEFYFDHPSQIDFFKHSIPDGVNLFKKLFGYVPKALVPSNGIFHPQLEKIVSETGVSHLYVNHFNLIPDVHGNLKKKYYPIGRSTSFGLTYYTRNCVFEPNDSDYCGIDFTIKQMKAAFQCGKPANISTHRVNFVGRLSKQNREKGLKELKQLLKAIVHKWPDVQFMSTGEFIEKGIS